MSDVMSVFYSQPVRLAALVEAALVLVTLFLLVQPEFAFRGTSAKVKGTIRAFGWSSLVIVFVWSFVTGSLLTLNAIRFKI